MNTDGVVMDRAHDLQWRYALAKIDACIYWLWLAREGRAIVNVPARLREYRAAIRRAHDSGGPAVPPLPYPTPTLTP